MATPLWKFKKTTYREDVGSTVLENLLDINLTWSEFLTHNPKQVKKNDPCRYQKFSPN